MNAWSNHDHPWHLRPVAGLRTAFMRLREFVVVHLVHRQIPIKEIGAIRKANQFNCSERNDELSPSAGGGSGKRTS